MLFDGKRAGRQTLGRFICGAMRIGVCLLLPQSHAVSARGLQSVFLDARLLRANQISKNQSNIMADRPRHCCGFWVDEQIPDAGMVPWDRGRVFIL